MCDVKHACESSHIAWVHIARYHFMLTMKEILMGCSITLPKNWEKAGSCSNMLLKKSSPSPPPKGKPCNATVCDVCDVQQVSRRCTKTPVQVDFIAGTNLVFCWWAIHQLC